MRDLRCEHKKKKKKLRDLGCEHKKKKKKKIKLRDLSSLDVNKKNEKNCVTLDVKKKNFIASFLTDQLFCLF